MLNVYYVREIVFLLSSAFLEFHYLIWKVGCWFMDRVMGQV